MAADTPRSSDLVRELIDALGPASVRVGDAIEARHQTDWSGAAPVCPVAWVRPTDTAGVAATLRLCHAHRVPVVPQGGLTGLAGGAVPLAHGVALSLERMNGLEPVDGAAATLTAQAGVTLQTAQEAAAAAGFQLGVDLGARGSCQIGGNLATNAGGNGVLQFGMMREQVLGLEVVLADGTVIRTGSSAPKSSAGYDLTALMVGAEGTLGLITELTLRLHGQPEAVSAAACGFARMADAVDCVIATIQTGLPMARIEFLDEASVAACNAYSGTDLALRPQLLVEFHGSLATVAEQAERFGEIAAGFGSTGFQWAHAQEDRTRLWAMRHSAYRAILASRPGCRAIVTDVCVPISALAEAVEETRADIGASPIPGPILGHVGDGNFHAILLIREGDAAEAAAAKALAQRMAERALRLGGTITGEHGIGFGKRGLMAAEHGAGWQVMGAVKRALDPENRMNPGKVVPDPVSG